MKTYFCVAEQNYCIDFLDEGFEFKKALSSSAPFYSRQPLSSLCFTLTVGDGLMQPEAPEAEHVGEFDNGELTHRVWRRPEGGYRIHIVSNADGLACVFEANADFTDCRASLFGDWSTQRFGLENCLMICFAFAAAHHQVVLIHASVPMVDGRAYMFQGKSGTGKSTHSKLWLDHIEGCELLNDDNPAIRVADDGSVYTYGTPWSGKTPCYRNLRVPAGGLLRLSQAPENKIRRHHKIEAFASLLSSCSTMIWDKPSYTAICDTVGKIVSRVPSFYFENLPIEASARLSYEHFKAAQ